MLSASLPHLCGMKALLSGMPLWYTLFYLYNSPTREPVGYKVQISRLWTGSTSFSNSSHGPPPSPPPGAQLTLTPACVPLKRTKCGCTILQIFSTRLQFHVDKIFGRNTIRCPVTVGGYSRDFQSVAIVI